MVLAGVTTLEEGFIAWLQERIAQRGLNQSEVGRRADVSKSIRLIARCACRRAS